MWTALIDNRPTENFANWDNGHANVRIVSLQQRPNFFGLSEACKEAIWIRQILKDLGVNFNHPTILFEDNQSVIKLITSENLTNRSKYIDTKTYIVKDYVENGLVNVKFCPTENMLADLFAKGLPKEKFLTLSNKLNLT